MIHHQVGVYTTRHQLHCYSLLHHRMSFQCHGDITKYEGHKDTVEPFPMLKNTHQDFQPIRHPTDLRTCSSLGRF